MSKTHITVKASKEGYRRAGHAFSATEATKIAIEDLTKDQIKALQDDPNLVVNGASSEVNQADTKAAEKEANDKITQAYEDAAEKIKADKAAADEQISADKKTAKDDANAIIKAAKEDAAEIVKAAKAEAVEIVKAAKAETKKGSK